MSKRGGCAWLLSLVLLAGGGGLGWAWWTLQRPFRGYPGDGLQMEVATGQPASTILRHLEADGVIPSALVARLYLVYALHNPPLKAGEYRFSEPLTTPQVLDKLRRGEVLTHAVTLVEGLTREETVEALAEAGFGDRRKLDEATASPALVADLDPEATDLEGYLFPDTYSFARGTPEREIVATLVANFRRHWHEEIAPIAERQARSRKGGPLAGVRAVVTLASIVEKEAQVDEERPVIAGVYRNRLARGIGLYADPTVIYALKRVGRWDGNLRRPDLQIDSPYNTYRYPGLPPGPICSPGLASLRAAAAPADVPYLYFVSRNDGTHVFSETRREHDRNVEIWQRRYWRRRWAEERRQEAGTEGSGGPPGSSPR